MFTPNPDPDFLTIPDPGSRGQKGIGSRIRIRITDFCKYNSFWIQIHTIAKSMRTRNTNLTHHHLSPAADRSFHRSPQCPPPAQAWIKYGVRSPQFI